MIDDESGTARDLYQLAVAYRPAPHPDLHQAEIGRWSDPELGPVVAYDATQDAAASAQAWDRTVAFLHDRLG